MPYRMQGAIWEEFSHAFGGRFMVIPYLLLSTDGSHEEAEDEPH
jgi:hypothetical protein